MLAYIESGDLGVLAYAQTKDHVQDLEQDVSHHQRVGQCGHDSDDLVDELAAIAVEQAFRPACNGGSGEDTGCESAPGATDTVHAHDVQRVVDAELRAEADGQVAERAGTRVHRGGTYVCMEGPQFSTRAESNLFRQWGASVVGMTNLPEAKLAREAELPYATVAMVTDYDCWHETEETVSVEAVLAVLRGNVAQARSLLSLVETWPDPGASPASSALEGALLTPLDSLSDAARTRLGPILGRYL